jgi:prepilin-type N-terminal cleavage/methylation domain-containing protein
MKSAMKRAGFTLLEVMVATLIMGIAVVSLLSSIGASMRNASRLTAYDRAVMLSRTKMDEILVDHRIPTGSTLEGNFDPETGWRAHLSPFETRGIVPGTPMLERVELEIWWTTPNGARHTFPLEGFRRNLMPLQAIQ